MKRCLEELDLSAQQGREPVHFTPREVGIVMAYMDDNQDGTIQYNEFAPVSTRPLPAPLSPPLPRDLRTIRTRRARTPRAHCRDCPTTLTAHPSRSSLIWQLMFNWMVEAMKLGFMQSQVSELQAYLLQHASSYDRAGSGKLTRQQIKRVLTEADLLKPALTPVQIFA